MMMLPCALADLSASLAELSDRALLNEVERLAGNERQAMAHLIASLAELDRRRLYLEAGCSSLFTYCTQVLHLSEHAAYRRIEAARAARKFPRILERLADGALTLTAVSLLAPHLTADNHPGLLDLARHQSKRDLDMLLAGLHAQPDVPVSIRRLPARRHLASASPLDLADDFQSTGPAADPRSPAAMVDEGPMMASEPLGRVGEDCSLQPAQCADGARTGTGMAPWTGAAVGCAPPAARSVVRPLAPERYRVQVTIGADTHAKLRRVQDLLRHVIPDGDPAAILDRALTVLLADLEKTRLAATDRPRPVRETARTSRHIPAAVKRMVWARDEGRCAFSGIHGRCTARGFLQIHHRVPYAVGGAASVENLELRCAAHNAMEADRYFGPERGTVERDQAAASP